jgi:hypothetical protein
MHKKIKYMHLIYLLLLISVTLKLKKNTNNKLPNFLILFINYIMIGKTNNYNFHSHR